MAYRYRRRYRRPGELPPGMVAAGLAVVAVMSAARAHDLGAAARHAGGGTRLAATTRMAAGAVTFAKAQTGKPYVWGADGPSSFDCSGLAWAAWSHAGLNWSRTTAAQQWATGKHVSTPQPGDLVFFAGGDGTPSSPGHVGIVTDPARHIMIDAYTAGTSVRYDTYGLPSSAGGLSVVVGFTDPGGS